MVEELFCRDSVSLAELNYVFRFRLNVSEINFTSSSLTQSCLPNALLMITEPKVQLCNLSEFKIV